MSHYKSFTNQEFIHSVHTLRRILPKLSFGLVIATYLISALIMGIFHSQNSPDILFKIAAFLVPLAIQTGRGTLVFFFQLNPARIQGRYSMAVISATVLLILSLSESCLVMMPYGLSWMIAVATLMLIGWVVEIMILKEILFASQIELYQDQERIHTLKEFYIARADMEQFLIDLKAGTMPKSLNTPVHPIDPGKKENNEEEKEESLIQNDQDTYPVGKSLRPSPNGRMAK